MTANHCEDCGHDEDCHDTFHGECDSCHCRAFVPDDKPAPDRQANDGAGGGEGDDHALRGRDRIYAEGAAAATARIVAWLRTTNQCISCCNRQAADAIERGDHEEGQGE